MRSPAASWHVHIMTKSGHLAHPVLSLTRQLVQMAMGLGAIVCLFFIKPPNL